jgi:hypothetical protein
MVGSNQPEHAPLARRDGRVAVVTAFEDGHSSDWKGARLPGHSRLLWRMLIDEGERHLGHFLPSMIHGQRMSSPWHLAILGHAWILLLSLVGGV